MGNPAPLIRERVPEIDREELVKIWWDKRAHEHVSDALLDVVLPNPAASPDEQWAYEEHRHRIAQTVRSDDPAEWDLLELGRLLGRPMHNSLRGVCDQEVDDV